MRTLQRSTLAAIVLIALADGSQAQTPSSTADKPYEPTVGMAGKDSVWVPTPLSLIEKMLDQASVTADDFVMDLGSGDGRAIIAAARRGARGLGIEYNPDLVEYSKRQAAAAGVSGRAAFAQGDMYEADISKASVMALFLLPVNLNKLAPKFLDLKPGSRIVLNTFGIDGWEPDYRTSLPEGSDCDSWCDILLLIVPAKVAGTWSLNNGGRLELTQQYQAVQGTATINGQKYAVEKGRLNGENLTFIANNQVFTGTVKGGRIEGTITATNGPVPWSATKQ